MSFTMIYPDIVFISLFMVLPTLVDGHPTYQQLIPNGEIVPHPCKLNFLWRGVGHNNVFGGGALNPFGSDFASNDYVWNSTICLKDSDGDGKSNGQELGDPDCIWTLQQKPSFNTGLSHPGVCDPIDSPMCEGKADFVDCEHGVLTCPVMETSDSTVISKFTAKLRRTAVPNRETTYICQVFEFPKTEQHIVAYEPVIDNHQMIHHIVIFGCLGSFQGDTSVKRCGMVPSSMCLDVIAVWSLGMSGHCMHKDCGILVGTSKGYRWAFIQIHWNNPTLIKGQSDSSGIVFYLSSKLRPFNAGILSIGQTDLAIPPGLEKHVETGRCDPHCTRTIIHDDITIVSVYNHMHYLGKAQTTDLIRAEHVQHLADDKLYNYDDPILHEFEAGVVVKSGDELVTTCTYKSTSRDKITYFGDDSDDEMCFSFLTYFPAENSETTCVSRGEKSQCMKTENTDYCDPRRFDLSSPELLLLLSNLQKLCTPGMCRSECLTFTKELYMDPCYEEVSGNLRKQLTRANDYDYHINVVYAAFDSCIREIMTGEFDLKMRQQAMDAGCNITRNATENGWLTFSTASSSKALKEYVVLAVFCLLAVSFYKK